MRLHQSLRIVRLAVGDRIVDGVMLFIDLFQPLAGAEQREAVEMHADGDMSLQRIDRGRVIVIVRRLCHRAVEEETDLDAMANDAFTIRRLLDNNPRDLTRADIRSIYAAAF